MVESAMGTHEVGVSRHTWELMPAIPQTRTQQSRKQTPQGLAEATATLREQQALAQEERAGQGGQLAAGNAVEQRWR